MAQGISGEAAWRRSRIVQAVASPVAGADWSQSVPAGHLWTLLAVTATLTTSAAVANRAPALVLGDGANPYLTIPAPAVQAASLAGTFGWAVGVTPAALGVRQVGSIPELTLPAAWTIAVSTLLLDVGDTWTAVRLLLLDVTAHRGRIDLEMVPDMLVGLVDVAGVEPG